MPHWCHLRWVVAAPFSRVGSLLREVKSLAQHHRASKCCSRIQARPCQAFKDVFSLLIPLPPCYIWNGKVDQFWSLSEKVSDLSAAGLCHEAQTCLMVRKHQCALHPRVEGLHFTPMMTCLQMTYRCNIRLRNFRTCNGNCPALPWSAFLSRM